jgi:glucose-6-phosphate isomerase
MNIHFFESLSLDEHVGAGGISQQEILEAHTQFEAAKETVNAAKAAGKLGFAKLPHAAENHAEIVGLAEKVAKECQNLVVIGIGGSDLGARAVHRALNHQFYNMHEAGRNGRPRLFFVGDTTDPVTLQEILEVVDWHQTTLVMISKSGNTVEQMSTFLFLRSHLIKAIGEEASRHHIITITDPETGALREITKREKYRSLPIPQDVGGRFSVLSSVGLFPLAVVGIDTEALLQGAADMDKKDDLAARYALLQYLAYKNHHQHISVLMPYTYSLRELGFWFRQLWAESLGKRVNQDGHVVEVGPTPVAAIGPTDQHSQVQLYREGPRDKVTTFITVKNPVIDFSIPEAFPDMDSVHYLHGHWFNEILLAEQESTAKALAEAGRPSCHIQIEQLDAHSLGGLLYFFELATAYAGELFNVNAYDQPGVERGKELMYKLLGH